MKKLPINSTSNHPETQGQLRMTDGRSASATHRLLTLVSSPFVERSEVRHPTLRQAQCDKSNFRNLDDFSDMEQVEYSERPYLSDEKWFV